MLGSKGIYLKKGKNPALTEIVFKLPCIFFLAAEVRTNDLVSAAAFVLTSNKSSLGHISMTDAFSFGGG